MQALSEIHSSERLVCVHAAAFRLCCSERTVRRLIQIGELPAIRINRRSWGVRVADITRLRTRLENR